MIIASVLISMNAKLARAQLKPVARTLSDHFTVVVSLEQNTIISMIDATTLTSAHQARATTIVAIISAVSNVHVAMGSRFESHLEQALN